MRKIFDFKKTIKRIYGKKMNLGKSFSNWDLSKKGYIVVEDLIRMSMNFSLPLNTKEANLIIQMGSEDGKKMKPNEFFEFITPNPYQKVIEQ